MFFMDFEGFPNTVLHRLLYSFAIFSVIFGCDNYKDRAREEGEGEEVRERGTGVRLGFPFAESHGVS